MKGIRLERGDPILWLDQYGFAHAGIVMEHIEPFVIIKGGSWTRMERVTIWMQAKNLRMPPMLALQHQVRRCPHSKRGKAVLMLEGAAFGSRHFCERCGKTL